MSGSAGTGHLVPDSAPADGSLDVALVAAIDALGRDDVTMARHQLSEAIDASSWWTVIHRLGVAGRALAVDADADAVDSALFGLAAPEPLADGQQVLMATAWTSLEVVSDLVAGAGFPAEVVLA